MNPKYKDIYAKTRSIGSVAISLFFVVPCSTFVSLGTLDVLFSSLEVQDVSYGLLDTLLNYSTSLGLYDSFYISY